MRQDAHPEPPVAFFPRIDASIHWRALFHGRLVSDWAFEQPKLHLNLQQLQAENEDETPVQKRGWQEALLSIYPLKINRLRVQEGVVAYIDQDPQHPLELTGVNLSASNIRNVRSPVGTFPSPFRVEADIFEHGHGIVEGSADFLAEPQPGVDARFDLRSVPLERLRPVTSRANIQVAGGILSGAGRVEYSAAMQKAELATLEIDGLRVDYVHSAVTAPAEKKRARQAKKSLAEAKESEWQFQVDHLHLKKGDFGFVNRATTPSYRISLSNADLELSNLSNRFRQGPARIRLEGTFMHSGDTFATAVFRPETKGADFDLLLAIEGTRVTTMNNLLRAHAGIDVVTGSLSVYSEIHVKDGRIEGYVKPFLKDLDIYNPRQEKGEGLIQKLKEGIAGALSALLKNPREEVATRFDLSGPVEDPKASTLQIVVQLVRNAFFKGILPGFEKPGGKAEGRKEKEK